MNNYRRYYESPCLAWFFCCSIFGMVFLPEMEIPVLGDNPKIILLAVEIMIVFVITSQFDNLIRFTFKKRK